MDWNKDYKKLAPLLGIEQGTQPTGLSADLTGLHRKVTAALAGVEPKPTAEERFIAWVRRSFSRKAA